MNRFLTLFLIGFQLVYFGTETVYAQHNELVVDTLRISPRILKKTASSSGASSAAGRSGAPNMVPMPSPTIASLLRASNVQSHLYTGAVQVQIPLLSLQSGSLNMPVSLSYRSNGVKVDEAPSTTGMTWALATGGVITRMVQGQPDEWSRKMPAREERKLIEHGQVHFENWWRKRTVSINFYTQQERCVHHRYLNTIRTMYSDRYDRFNSIQEQLVHCEGIHNNAAELSYNAIKKRQERLYSQDKNTRDQEKQKLPDYEPDKYFFSFPQGVGYFYMDPSSGKIHVCSEADLKIETLWSGGEVEFSITTPDGTRYIFGNTMESRNHTSLHHYQKQYTSSHFEQEENTYSPRAFANSVLSTYRNYQKDPETDYQKPNVQNSYTSSWHLTQVQSANGQDRFTLHYHKKEGITNKQNSLRILLDEALKSRTSKLQFKAYGKGYTLDQTTLVSEMTSLSSTSLLKSITGKTGRIDFSYTGLDQTQPKLHKIAQYDPQGNHYKTYSMTYLPVFAHTGIAEYSGFNLGYMLSPEDFTHYQPTSDKLGLFKANTGIKSDPAKRKRLFLHAIFEHAQNETEKIQLYEFDYYNKEKFPTIGSYQQNFYGYYVPYQHPKEAFYNFDQLGGLGIDYYAHLAYEPRRIEKPKRPTTDYIKHGLLKSMKQHTGKIQTFHYNIEPWGCTLDRMNIYQDSLNQRNHVATTSYRYQEPSQPFGVNTPVHLSGGKYLLSPSGFTAQNLTQGAVKGYGKVSVKSSNSNKVTVHYFSHAGMPEYDNKAAQVEQQVTERKPYLRYYYNVYKKRPNGQKGSRVLGRIAAPEGTGPITVQEQSAYKGDDYLFEYQSETAYKEERRLKHKASTWGKAEDRDYLRGKLLKTQTFDLQDYKNHQAGYPAQALFTTELDYTILPVLEGHIESVEVQVAPKRIANGITKALEISRTPINYALMRLAKKTSTNWVDGKQLKSTQTISYLPKAPRYQSQTVTFDHFTKKRLTQKMEYVFNSPEQLPEVQHYLQQKHIKNLPAATIQFEQLPETTTPVQTGGTKYRYRMHQGHAVLDRQLTWMRNHEEGEWEETLKIDHYTKDLKIAQYHGIDGIPISFLWEGDFPIIKAVNKPYPQLKKGMNLFADPQAQLSAYKYHPILGLQEERHSSGKQVYYHYDRYGRLSYTEDQDQNLLKSYQYHIGQPVTEGDFGIGDMQVEASFIVR